MSEEEECGAFVGTDNEHEPEVAGANSAADPRLLFVINQSLLGSSAHRFARLHIERIGLARVMSCQ